MGIRYENKTEGTHALNVPLMRMLYEIYNIALKELSDAPPLIPSFPGRESFFTDMVIIGTNLSGRSRQRIYMLNSYVCTRYVLLHLIRHIGQVQYAISLNC